MYKANLMQYESYFQKFFLNKYPLLVTGYRKLATCNLYYLLLCAYVPCCLCACITLASLPIASLPCIYFSF